MIRLLCLCDCMAIILPKFMAAALYVWICVIKKLCPDLFSFNNKFMVFHYDIFSNSLRSSVIALFFKCPYDIIAKFSFGKNEIAQSVFSLIGKRSWWTIARSFVSCKLDTSSLTSDSEFYIFMGYKYRHVRIAIRFFIDVKWMKYIFPPIFDPEHFCPTKIPPTELVFCLYITTSFKTFKSRITKSEKIWPFVLFDNDLRHDSSGQNRCKLEIFIKIKSVSLTNSSVSQSRACWSFSLLSLSLAFWFNTGVLLLLIDSFRLYSRWFSLKTLRVSV